MPQKKKQDKDSSEVKRARDVSYWVQKREVAYTKAHEVAAELYKQAAEIVLAGEDIRGNKSRPSVGTLLDSAQKAVNDIIRLRSIVEADEVYKQDIPHELIVRYKPIPPEMKIATDYDGGGDD